jgi:hypothetical protein
MSSFEEELKRALARVEPPEGFTERLAARIASMPPSKAPLSKRPVYLRWAAIAATAVMIFSGLAYQHQRQVQGQQAKEKLFVALRITSSKLQQTQQQIKHVERNQ